MTLDEINQQLAALANCGDPTFAQAAQYIAQATQAAQAGQMSPQELAETLKDMQRQASIVEDMSQLQFKETLNTCINGLITIIGAVY
jgi:membrane-bound lytic murein transglycosylase B